MVNEIRENKIRENGNLVKQLLIIIAEDLNATELVAKVVYDKRSDDGYYMELDVVKQKDYEDE